MGGPSKAKRASRAFGRRKIRTPLKPDGRKQEGRILAEFPRKQARVEPAGKEHARGTPRGKSLEGAPDRAGQFGFPRSGFRRGFGIVGHRRNRARLNP